MALLQAFAHDGAVLQLLGFILASAIVCNVVRSIYRLYFHPLSKFPGPKLAAVSDAWFAYHCLSGRWPWAVEATIKKYGNVVRIAPDELVFSTPEAFKTLYGSQNKGLETFHKTQINNHGNDKHGGILWEWDPVRHQQVARQLAPAFSGRALRAKEPVIHKYIDLFVERMRQYGNTFEGVDLNQWVNWLSVDMSADMAYNRKMNALEEMKQPPYLSLLHDFNRAIAAIQVCWRFPLLAPVKYAYLLFTSNKGHSHIRAHSKQLLEHRIRAKEIEHVDFLESLIPANREPPKDPQEWRHIEQIAGQVLVAGFEPPAAWCYFTTYFLASNKTVLRYATEEIRRTFSSYEDITADGTAGLVYLIACLRETLRMVPVVANGMPVRSPGAIVDGDFIPKGTICQSSFIALARNEKNFHDADNYRPERWLPRSHDLYNASFDNDNRDGLRPFSQGPRVCTGKEIAWWESRIYVAKVLWSFDLELTSGQKFDMRRDLKSWGLWDKPKMHVRFSPKSNNVHG